MSKRSAKEGARGMFMLQPGRLQRTVEPLKAKKMPECPVNPVWK